MEWQLRLLTCPTTNLVLSSSHLECLGGLLVGWLAGWYMAEWFIGCVANIYACTLHIYHEGQVFRQRHMYTMQMIVLVEFQTILKLVCLLQEIVHQECNNLF